ncbi:DNA-binding transcriptional regulator, LysR family [Lachnospiraceae bacterium]|nr:DNA-binding transcriptional regulator, LysR family [Lachnospiraceae bacterium]
MDINKYLLFADVAETKNFTKSGDNMGYTQPGVSHILKSMENELGFSLFNRTRQGIELTPNAEVILPIVRRLLSVNEQLSQTVSLLNGLEIGHLTIAAFASTSRMWLPKVLHRFQKQYPGIEVELLEGGTDDIVSWINDSIADFGLLSRRHTESLEWIHLAEDPLVAVLPKGYAKEGTTSFPISQMHDKPFIISAEGTDYDIHFALEDSGVTPNERFSSKDDSAIVSMVANDLGLSILPKLVVEGNDFSFDAFPLEPYYSRELGIAYRSASSLSPAARHFIDLLIEEIEP